MKKPRAMMVAAILLFPIEVTATDLGVVSTADYLRFPVVAVDSAGIEQPPDSGHVLLWYEGEGSANAASYTNRWTGSGASGSQIDSVRYAGHTYFYFIDQVTDIDNDEGNGIYTGVVVLYTDGEPYPNRFTFTIAGDELADYWAEVTRLGDSIDAYDDWVGRQSEITNLDGWNPTTLNDISVPDIMTYDVSGYDADSSGKAGERLNMAGDTSGWFDAATTPVVAADTNSSGELMAVMPDDWTTADSTAYQGLASGLDSTTVARAVWNAPGANHTAAGTFGFYLDAPISGVSGGSGAYSVTLVAFDTANAQTVAGVMFAVRNISQSSLLALTGTGPSGAAAVNLNAGDYLVSATAPGYFFAPFDTLTVSGPLTDSVRGYQFDPGSPESPSLCRVYGYLYTPAGEPESGAAISAYLPSGVTRFNGSIVSPYPATATTDDTGYFYLDLIPTPSLTGLPLYEFTISRADGTILRKRLSVPDASNWQLAW